jgi:hypothetical protein
LQEKQSSLTFSLLLLSAHGKGDAVIKVEMMQTAALKALLISLIDLSLDCCRHSLFSRSLEEVILVSHVCLNLSFSTF